MGTTNYSFDARALRANESGLTDHTVALATIFKQQEQGCAHASMLPMGVHLREARDSATNPFSVPIIVGLDDTGSMHHIPRQMVAEGLPTMVSTLVQAGVASPAICFIAIGDHEKDDYPLQVGQFESGDEELDMWLTRTYIEGGGGSNKGESYLLGPLFAAGVCETDAWDKRQQKGFLFTIGDEPALTACTREDIEALFGADATEKILARAGISTAQSSTIRLSTIRDACAERWHWFHIHCRDGSHGSRPEQEWKALLGQNLLKVESHTEIPQLIAETVLSHLPVESYATEDTAQDTSSPQDEAETTQDEEKQKPKLF